MRRLVVTLDDELSPLLAKYPNQNEIVRQALRLYIGDIATDTREGLRSSLSIVAAQLKKQDHKLQDMDGKIDYIAGRVQ